MTEWIPLKAACVDAGQYGLNIAAEEYQVDGFRLLRTTDLSGAREDVEPVFVSGPLEHRHRLKPGDLLLSRSGTIGMGFIVGAEACSSTFAGYLIRFRPHGQTDPRYLHYVTQSESFQATVRSEAVSSTITNFNAERYANVRVPRLNYQEQRRIADFLDDQVGRVDAATRLQVELIRLTEQRFKALLEGIFDGPPRPLKTFLRQPPCYGVLVPEFVDKGVPFIRVGSLDDLSGCEPHDLPQIPRAMSVEYRRTIVHAGDVLVSVVGSTDKAAVVTPALAGANVARAVARLQLRKGVPPIALVAWIETAAYKDQVRAVTSSDTAQPTLNMGDLRNFRISLPTDNLAGLEDQVNSLREARARLRRDLQRIDVLLAERRRALITACVTGEFNVPAAGNRAGDAALHGVAR